MGLLKLALVLVIYVAVGICVEHWKRRCRRAEAQLRIANELDARNTKLIADLQRELASANDEIASLADLCGKQGQGLYSMACQLHGRAAVERQIRLRDKGGNN